VGSGCGIASRLGGRPAIPSAQPSSFFDESIDDTGVIAVAGYLASAGEWASFSREWAALLRPMGTLRGDGKYHFKMSDMAGNDERMSRVPAFHSVINNHVRASIGATVDPDDVNRAMVRIHTIPPVLIIWSDEAHSPYFMALRTALDALQNLRRQRPDLVPPNEPISVFFDENSEDSLVREVWDRYKSDVRGDVDLMKSLRGPYFEKDDEFLPLQAADFRAWWMRKWSVELGGPGLKAAFEGPGPGNLYPYELGAGMVFHSMLVSNEDYWVGLFKTWAAQSHPDKMIIDSGPELVEPERHIRNDPPAPLSLTNIKRVLGRFFRGQSS
jgi:hypothetical protein